MVSVLKHILNVFKAWIEGFAILMAVALVATIGSFVDWKKAPEFYGGK
jgi:hypothetical protein